MELIISFIFIGYLVKAIIEASKNEKRQDEATYKNPWDKIPMGQTINVGSSKTQTSKENNRWQQAARKNIEKARQRAVEKIRTFEVDVMRELNGNESHTTTSSKPTYTAMQQVYEGREEARNTSILQRAKGNADINKMDVTLESMEAEHNHSERVSAAVHHHPEDVMPESMLGTIEDLMVKGYDGNLCFERDFVGEGLDMISRFNVPSDVPDFS